MENKKERLFSEFAPVSRQEWLDKITVDLKGADFNKKLVWRTNEGFSVQPFYLREDVENFPTTTALPGRYPFVRGNKVNDNTAMLDMTAYAAGMYFARISTSEGVITKRFIKK